MEKTWLIISWAHNDYLDGDYGRLLMQYEGTYEDAIKMAKEYVSEAAPIGIVEAAVCIS